MQWDGEVMTNPTISSAHHGASCPTRRQTRRRGGYDRAKESGQATVALAGVVALAALAAAAIAMLAGAMVDRAHARAAADAVALAGATDGGAAAELGGWYDARGVGIDHDGERVIAQIGSSQAAAWAVAGADPNRPAPALKAIIARAEQLLQVPLRPVAWRGTSVTLTRSEAAILHAVSAELGLCPQGEAAQPRVGEVFELC